MTTKPILSGRETRVLPITTATELRVSKRDGKSLLEGLTAPFGKWSLDLGGFIERIAPGAFAKALNRSDPVGVFNHSSDNILGRRSAGTLRLNEASEGLRYEIDLPPTDIGNRVAVGVERGDITGNSFAFVIARGGDSWEDPEGDGLYRRTIHEFDQILDVGPVLHPAYPDTAVALRSLDAIRARHPGPGLAYYQRMQRTRERD